MNINIFGWMYSIYENVYLLFLKLLHNILFAMHFVINFDCFCNLAEIMYNYYKYSNNNYKT